MASPEMESWRLVEHPQEVAGRHPGLFDGPPYLRRREVGDLARHATLYRNCTESEN